MTYEERLSQFCNKQCSDREGCEYLLCNNTFRCDYLSGIIYGWELGQKDTLEEIEKLIKTTGGDGEDYHYNLYMGLLELVNELKKG